MSDVDLLLARITPAHRLLLVAALGPVESARHSWSRWRRSVAFDAIDPESARVLPLLARRPDVVDRDDPVSGRVLGMYRRAWVANERSFSAADVALAEVAAAGVDLLHVEALPLANLSGDHGTRPAWDVDVCVPRRSMRTALRVLRGLGWTELPRLTRARWRRWPRRLARGDARLRLIESRPWPGADSSAWSRSVPTSTAGIHLLGAHDVVVHAAVRSQQPWQPIGGYWVADLTRAASALGHRDVGGLLVDGEVLACARSHGAVDALTAAVRATMQVLG